jgi:F-type H+-transporting ATPase subunit h
LSSVIEQAKDAHVGVVKSYSLPPVPKPPTLPSDLASELSAYDATEPALAVVTDVTPSSSEEVVGGADAYLSFLEQDLPKEEHHH